MTEEAQKTSLYDSHVAAGGKLVPFAGWQLPVRYSGVIEEHKAVRNAAGLFDVSHMGEIFVEGPEALQALESLTCNKVASLYDGKALYSAIINEKGGVVDDIIIYRFSENRYLLCVNAANIDKDFAWLVKHNKHDAEITNHSSKYAQIAIQGPKALGILQSCGLDLSDVKGFHFIETEIFACPAIVALTGYTGERGAELFLDWDAAPLVWESFWKLVLLMA